MSDLWNRIPAKYRKVIYLGGIALAVVLLILVVGPDNRHLLRKDEPVIEHILTDEDATKVTLQTLAAKIDSQRAEQGKLQRQLDKVRSDLRQIAEESGPSRAMQKELADIRAKIKASERRSIATTTAIEEFREQVRSGDVFTGYAAGAAPGGARGTGSPSAPALPFVPVSPAMRDVDAQASANAPPGAAVDKPQTVPVEPRASQPLEMTRDAEEFFRNAPVPRVTTAEAAPGIGPGGRQAPPRRRLNPRSIHGETDSASVEAKVEQVHAERKRRAKSEQPDDTEEVVIPTGSIIEAVVLSGMDAPTNQGTRRDPFPALLRFKKEAILPSRYHADVRECFLVAAGYGDMSSERVFLRGETLSCGFDGGVFSETAMDSYAVGEDGKAGVRGRLVSKDGLLLSRALVAGFAEGISKAFDINVVPVINTSDTNNKANVQTLDAADAARTGAIGGISTAMEKLADRYLELADQIFPVVELDAGRIVTFIVTRPVRMRVPKQT